MDTKNNKLLLVCPCNKELLSITSISNRNMKCFISYHCLKDNKNSAQEISLDEYKSLLIHQKETKPCSYSSHEKEIKGIIYCCTCNHWLCKDCLISHDNFLFAHLFSFIELSFINYCSFHPGNKTSFYCENCNEEYCMKCQKKHKKHTKNSYEEYKTILLNKYGKIINFESLYKTITSDNLTTLQKDFCFKCDDKNIQYYKEYYSKVQSYNKTLFEFLQRLYSNINGVKNLAFYNSIKVVSQCKFERLMLFEDYYKQRHTYNNSLYSIQYKKRNEFSLSLTRIIQTDIENIERVIPISDDKLFIFSPHKLYVYHCLLDKFERIELGNCSYYNVVYLEKSKTILIQSTNAYLYWKYNLDFSECLYGLDYRSISKICELDTKEIAVLYEYNDINYLAKVSLDISKCEYSCLNGDVFVKLFKEVEIYDDISDFSCRLFLNNKTKTIYLTEEKRVYQINLSEKKKTFVFTTTLTIYDAFSISDTLFALILQKEGIMIYTSDSYQCIHSLNTFILYREMYLTINFTFAIITEEKMINILNKENGHIMLLW